MKYVLDSNVALKIVLPEQDSDKATQLLLDFQNQLHELIAPDVFPVEVALALTRSERQHLLARGEAAHKLANILSARPDFRPSLPLLPRAVEISSHARIGVYDCLYVALAEHAACELITADVRLIKALPGFPIVDLATWP